MGEPVDVSSMMELGPLVDLALSGEDNYRRLYVVTKQNKLLVAAPVKVEDGNVLGVMVFTGTLIGMEGNLGQIPALLGGSLLLFTCGGIGGHSIWPDYCPRADPASTDRDPGCRRLEPG